MIANKFAFASGLFFCFASLSLAQTAPAMELWYQQHSYLTSPQAVASVEATISQAAAVGYTGVVLWDSSLNAVNLPGWNLSYLQQVIAFARSKGMKVMPSVYPYGYSNDILNQNPNLAEGQHVAGTRFQVNPAGNALNVINSSPGFQNAGFESPSAWFSYLDSGVSWDPSVSHSGSASARISNTGGNARLYQSFSVTPWRQYHFRVWMKTQNFTNTPAVYIMDSTDWNAQRLNVPIPVAQNQDWTAYDFTLNSASSTSLSLLMGEWGGASGNLWVDDAVFEETGLVYVVRRGGAPLHMYDPGNPSRVFNEGSDFNAISDPEVAPGGFGDHWHTPPVVTLPSGTSLRPGQTVALDYYAVVPIYGSQVGMCLTDPGVLQYLQANATSLASLFPAGTPLMLGYDEMRHLNSCALCKSKNMTAGQLLAWNVQQSVSTFQSLTPGSELYFWSDMFDPNMNAHNDYYLAEGDISGSWLGLPANATVVNWNLGGLAASLKFFAGMTPQQTTPFRQVIAGFYDPGDNNGANAAATELQQATGIPGVVGMLYTTWVDNYGQLGSFAAAAKAGWPAYLASVGVSNVAPTGSVAGTVTDGANRAVAGAQISAVLSGGSPVTAVAGNDGTFHLSGLPLGTYAVSVSAAGYVTATISVNVTSGAVAAASVALNPVSTSSFAPIRVNAGGQAYTDSSGNVWSADTGFAGGFTYSTSAPVAFTSTPALYQTERYNPGTLEYRFSVPNGSYSVTLKFAEIYFNAPGQRIFNISVNGTQVETSFDPFAAAGASNKAVDRTYAVNVTNGAIDIQFASITDNAKVSAIQILAAGSPSTATAPVTTPSSFNPIRVNAGGSAYTDSLGQSWSADTGSTGGSTYSSDAGVSGTSDPALYQTERYANGGALEYRFNVPNGNYVVNLKFAEMWFTSTGQRLFNIALNGQTCELNFDIVRAAGGPNRAVDLRYPITVTNGVIDIQMQSLVDNAKVSAIEITQTAFTPIRVNAGGPQVTDPLGRVWAADSGFLGGALYGTNNAIRNTPAPAIYQTERFGTTGSLEYKYSLANGTYTVNLKFAEIWFTSPGQRMFNIVINGQQVASSFDPLAASGGANTAIDKQYQAAVTDGALDIQLTPIRDNPKISAIEIFQ
jgi:hypothetical protein